MIDFNFDILKAKSAVLYIAKHLHTADFHKVFKILYFAERDHLATYGRPIVGDRYIAMRNGPVPSTIYDIFKFARNEMQCCNAYDELLNAIEVEAGFNLKINQEPDLDELSISEIKCLDNSIKENHSLSFDKLKEKSHDIAWQKANRNDEMDIIIVAQAGGANEEMMKYIIENKENNNIIFA